MPKLVGILTSGGDTPGLNAAIRAVGKSLHHTHGMKLLGIHDGFRGLMENRISVLDDKALSGILTRGGTILGSSRDKPHKMPVGGRVLDMTDVMIENYEKNQAERNCLSGRRRNPEKRLPPASERPERHDSSQNHRQRCCQYGYNIRI